MKHSKYHNTKITVDGITFDSKKEYERWCELRLLEKAGAITELQRQIRFEVIPAQCETHFTGEYYKKGDKKGLPKLKTECLEQAVEYIADFVYRENGRKIVEDTKGFRTADYIIKRKLMLWRYGIKIREI